MILVMIIRHICNDVKSDLLLEMSLYCICTIIITVATVLIVMGVLFNHKSLISLAHKNSIKLINPLRQIATIVALIVVNKINNLCKAFFKTL